MMLRGIASFTYGRYVVASAAALGVDMAAFLLLLQAGLPAMATSTLAYLAGIAVHWLLATRFVFDDARAVSGAERTRKKGLFVGTALIGLTLTTLIVGAGTRLGLDPRLAKIIAVGISFQANWLARRALVFRA